VKRFWLLEENDSEASIPQTITRRCWRRELGINMGPQHPSTHGVLRVKLSSMASAVIGSECIIGYLHRGVEKIGGEPHVSHNLLPMSIVWTTSPPSAAAWDTARQLKNAYGGSSAAARA